jgi:predicted RNA-binding protein YlqC (UPF0109 family)
MSESTGDVRVLIEQLAKALVDDPAQVSVNQVEEGTESVLELTVGPNDMGRVIGKQGRTARAMRNLLAAAGLKSNKRFVLEILE